MEKQFKHISHKFIDSLSDGVFSIALTLLGLNVVELVPEISQSENFNSAILENWPTLFSYFLGFVFYFLLGISITLPVNIPMEQMLGLFGNMGLQWRGWH